MEESGVSEQGSSEAPFHAAAPEAGPAQERSASLDVAALMAGLRVTHEEGGGLRIEAPPAVARQLAQLLDGLAGLLRSAAAASGKGATDERGA